MADRIDLDHFAIGLRRVGPTLNTLVGDFGARVLFGGANLGFKAMQLDCGDLSIELLEPHNVELNDFLQRFLDRSGEGPHHMTFKTDDIERELDRVRDAGYNPVGVNIGNPWWREAFLHPKEAGGTVVQIAQSAFERPDEIDPEIMAHIEQMTEPREFGPGQWWPDPPEPAADRAFLRRVVVVTEEIGKALGLYETLLQGESAEHGEGWVELGWPGGGRIRLELAAGRPEGVDRLEWTHAGEYEERRVGETRCVLYPED